MLRLIWLALGTFAIGTEGFMIAGLLPTIAADLHVTVGGAGQLVTVFALVYALGAPVLATVTAGFERRRLLALSMGAFLVANVLAASASRYVDLLGARILLALAAGVFSPAAAAFAGTSVAPHHRGRALAIVVGGVSASVALGAPLGTWIGNALGWRATFLVVAGLSALALLGVALRLPTQPPQGAATLGQRVRIVASPGVGRALLVTLLWSTGGFVIYTYSALLFRTVGGLVGPEVAIGLLAFGIGAVIGTFGGGQIVDRFGTGRLLVSTLFGLAALSASLPVIAATLVPPAATVALLTVFGAWGVVGWAFHPAQQSRLMTIAPAVAPIVLSLNQSALYVGMALGAGAGALTLKLDQPASVGWVAVLCELGAATVLLLGRRRALPAVESKPQIAKAS